MEKSIERIVVYPGTFDPLTNGHLSLIKRGKKLFDTVVVAVAESTPKVALFSLEERVQLIRGAVEDIDGIVVESFSGLLVEYATKRGAHAILRGMRAVSDFEYEFQLALMNRRLCKELQTIFLMTDYQWLYISSTIIKAAASHGGNVEGLVPDNVLQSLHEKYEKGHVRGATPCLAPSVGGFKI